ncbi:hypothetical protein K501DRAFT_74099 [Backusella circina FSU 941]|nr:hypothetical protein K501DRAFT_74099 [Backusella circina FSU 941]
MLESIEDRISSLEYLKKESREFLNEHQKSLKQLNLEEAGKKPISRTLSYPNLADLAVESASNNKDHADKEDEEHDSDGTTTAVKRRAHPTNNARNARSMYIPDSSLHDPFEYKKNELNHLINGLRHELKGFQSCLEDTEKLVNSVQLDIDDTRNRMETYIKDIPQSHYSALKTLEVDIDSILSKRAKNPWLDTGYTLLSYLLTLFALVVWIIIYLLKLGKKVLFFPKKLWHSYSDYLMQRNQVVRNASLRSVSR